MAETNDLALVSADDLSLVDSNSLNANQLALILKKTPKQYVKQRTAKGGGTWDYVSGGYIKKCLNLMFGWDWDFDILSAEILFGEVVIKGKLTCRSNGKSIVKTQYGNKEIVYKTEKVFNPDGTPKMVEKYGKQVQETQPSQQPLSIGNDFKAAATDCLKKCASEIGIAADIYNKDDFREIKVDTSNDSDSKYVEILELFEEIEDFIPADEFDNVKRIIDKQEKNSYDKILRDLKKWKDGIIK